MKSNKEALLRSEERLKLAQVAAGAGIWDVNLITGENEWSEELFGLFGLDFARTKASFEVWKNVIHPDDRVFSWNSLRECISQKSPLDIEYRIIYPSGELRWIRALGNTIYDEEGRPLRMLGICLDITSQKEKEQKILELATQRKIALDAARLGWWQFNPVTGISMWDEGYRKIFGVSDYSRPNQEILEKIIHPDDLSELWKKVEASINPENPQPYYAEYRIIRPDGQLKWIEAHGTATFEGEGAERHAVNFVGTVRDITRRKSNEKLIEYNEQRNRVLSEVASELLISQDIQKAINNICQIVMKFLNCQLFFNFHFVPEVNKLHLNAYHGISPEEARKIEWLNFGDAVCGCVARDCARIIVESVQESRDELTQLIRRYGIHAYCCHPLTSAENIIGTLSFGTTERDNWTASEISMMESISGMMSVAIQRKRLEEELISSRESFERAQMIGNIGSWRLNLLKNELIWSDETYRIFNVPKGIPQTYESFLSIIHPDDRSYVNSKWTEALDGKDYDIEHRIIVEGKIKWVREKAFLEFGEDGKLSAGFGIIQDITNRKNAENDLKRAKMRLDLALENANIGTWEHDISSNVVFLDERSEKMLGLESGSFDGSFSTFEKLIQEEDLEHLREAINNALKGVPYETIFRTRPMNGKPRYISAKALAIKNEKGEITALSGVNFDITELREGTEQLISKLNMDLLRSNSDLQQFAYVASHDLQEPLRMVASFVQLLQMRYADKLDQDANEYINYAVNGSKRMYELINGLLAYSRVETRPDKLGKVNMETVLAKVKENLKLLINETNARVTNDTLPFVTADENQMIQVLQNLIENGIKFRKGEPVIHVSCRKQKGMYSFSVKDEGIGIEKQYFERIFRIFQKLHTQQEYKGTGIGLAICKRIVERHGGEMWVDSEPGRGSEFFFTIPG